jgi:predicted RNA methylase
MPTTLQTLSSDRIAIANFTEQLRSGNRLVQKVVIDIMSEAFGGGAATGCWHWKYATDLIESAMARLIATGQYQTLEEFENLQLLVPHHQIRSEEQMELQQFSTTLPLAWIVRELVQIRSTDTLLEPSAGTGILAAAISSKLKGTLPLLVLNEISKSRNKLLKEIFPEAWTYSLDAEYLNDVLSQDRKPTSIGMNPPFSCSIGKSKRNSDACLKHVRSALFRLKPQGRLVAIVAHWLSPEKYPEYFANLPARLQTSIFVEGKHYRHHGTTMDVRILVFDKIPGNNLANSIYRTKLTIEQLADLAITSTPNRPQINS